jgi:PAS domain S-box-containing protein
MKTANKQGNKLSTPASHEDSSRLLSLSQTPNCWLWEVDNHGIYTYCSPTIIDILGYSPDEILGKTLWQNICGERSWQREHF